MKQPLITGGAILACILIVLVGLARFHVERLRDERRRFFFVEAGTFKWEGVQLEEALRFIIAKVETAEPGLGPIGIDYHGDEAPGTRLHLHARNGAQIEYLFEFLE